MPGGYLWAVAIVAVYTFAALTPLRRPPPLGFVSSMLGYLLNELPFIAFYWLLAWTLLTLHDPGGRLGWRRLTRILFTPLPLWGRDVQRISNISYGDAGRRNRLDLYRPRSRPAGGSPVLIHFQGGHLRTGGKSREARPLLYWLASPGWLCASANYRLREAGRFPRSLIDAKQAIAWVRRHAAEHGADPSVLVVAGSSAGAHLASMAGLTPNDPAFQPGDQIPIRTLSS